MKFKSIYILFSSILLFCIALLFLLPPVILSPSLLASFWQINWPFILILILLFFGFSLFYFTNRRLFVLLEKEDWSALAFYLENRVIKKGKYSSRLVRLLANSYLVLADAAAVISLENKVAITKPGIIDAHALVFGAARILGGDASGAVRFFGSRKETVKRDIKEWVHWYYGFALLLNYQFEDSGQEFSFLAKMAKDGIITGLSSFFLYENIAYLLPGKKSEIMEISSLGKERTLAALPSIKDWDTTVSRFSKEIYAAVIAKYIKESALWIY